MRKIVNIFLILGLLAPGSARVIKSKKKLIRTPGKKPTKVVNNTDVASTLETENNISSNVVKTQIDTTGGTTTDVATVSASEDTVSDLPAQTMEELNEKV